MVVQHSLVIIICCLSRTIECLKRGESHITFCIASISYSRIQSIWAVGSAQRGLPNFKPLLLGAILVFAIPLLIIGSVLVGKIQPWDRVMVGASVIFFRLWMIWEWIQINSLTERNKLTIRMNLAIHILAALASIICMIPWSLLNALIVS